MKKKWIWITVPAVVIGLGVLFAGGAVFAQEAGNTTGASPNWTAMYEYCRGVLTGNVTPGGTNVSGYCGVAPGDVNAAGGRGCGAGAIGTRPGGMMGNGSPGRGMMAW